MFTSVTIKSPALHFLFFKVINSKNKIIEEGIVRTDYEVYQFNKRGIRIWINLSNTDSVYTVSDEWVTTIQILNYVYIYVIRLHICHVSNGNNGYSVNIYKILYMI